MEHDNGHSSTSQGSIVFKVLIDFEEYQSLLEAKKFMSQYSESAKKKLEIESKTNASKTHEVPETLTSEGGFHEQIGGSMQSFQDLLEKKVKELFTQYFPDVIAKTAPADAAAVVATPSPEANPDVTNSVEVVTEQPQEIDNTQPSCSNQCEQIGGGGANDLFPPVVGPITKEIPPSYPPLNEFVNHTTKGNPNDKFDKERLLESVPLGCRQDAKTLLDVLGTDTLSVTFDSDGHLFIDNDAIPQANFYTLFPLLFKSGKNKHDIPGYVELATQIMSRGLGHLIHTPKFLKRKPNWSWKLEEPMTKFKARDSWWYIGP